MALRTVHHSPGGMQENLETLADGLVSLGHRVVVITSRHYKGVRELTVRGVEHHFVEGTVPESYGHGFFEQVYETFRQLDRTIGFDGVYSESLAAAAFCQRVTIPLVFRLHAIQMGWRNSESLYTSAVWRALTWQERVLATLKLPKALLRECRACRLTRRVYRAATALVLDSEFSRSLLLKTVPWIDQKKLRVIPLSIDTTKFVPLDKDAAKARLGLSGTVLLFLSRITLLKGPWVALRAMEALGLPDVKLLVVGVGHDQVRFSRDVARLKLPGVRFIGSIPREERPLYYSAADLFLYPEIMDPAFGLVGAEALACGTPVVGSNAGAIPEVMGDCGFLFPRGDVGALCNRIREALEDPSRLRELGQRGRAWIQARFNHAKMVADLTELFEGLK